MIDVILHCPKIPSNTGAIIRLCANTMARLHLIKPLAFSLEDKKLRRAGLDYHEFAQIAVHDSWEACRVTLGDVPVFAFTTKAQQHYHRVQYSAQCGLLFGSETSGLPDDILGQFDHEHLCRLPMRPQSRSLNLANTVSVAVYEAWQQQGFSGAV